jgi:hypothetical protein
MQIMKLNFTHLSGVTCYKTFHTFIYKYEYIFFPYCQGPISYEKRVKAETKNLFDFTSRVVLAALKTWWM